MKDYNSYIVHIMNGFEIQFEDSIEFDKETPPLEIKRIIADRIIQVLSNDDSLDHINLSMEENHYE